MTSKEVLVPLATVLVALFLLSSSAIQADSRSQGGVTFVQTTKLEKPKKVDELWAAFRVPPDFDQRESLDLVCSLFTSKQSPDNDDLDAANVKADWRVMAYVVDRGAGSFQSLNVASGTVRTGPSGIVFVPVAVPAAVRSAIFTDGFESGDVSAFFVGYGKLRTGKKLNDASFDCDLDEVRR